MNSARSHSLTIAAISEDRRQQLGRRAQLLAGASVAYNVVESVVAVAAGSAASSIALIGFGLDSLVEVGSGLVILWQFRHKLPETRERQALRCIGISFFALAAYVSVESMRALLVASEAEHSTLGIWIAALSLAVMPFLSWAQRRTGRELGSGSVVADSKQTLLCTYLSAVLLAGLLVNSLFGWWWADPIAGPVIAGVATRDREVVSGGILQGYFLSTYTARKLGMQTTGNAGGSHNLIIEPGELALDGLLQKMNRGLLVTELLGHGINYVTGDYSRGAAGYWIENGSIAYPVEEITIAGNLKAMLAGIVAVGNDVLVRGSKQTGSILVDRMTVAGE